jgi:glycosyltransferase involved in cell wall biosynthesis
MTKEAKPLISLIVPVYNAAAYLPLFCKSVLAQTYDHFEVLMWDDGSTDNSLEIARQYEADPRFRVMQWEKNQGLNRAWFELLTRVRGEYWCSRGADDVLKPQFLERRVEVIRRFPYAAFVHGPPEVIDADGKRSEEVPDFGDRQQFVEVEQALEMSLLENHINQPGVVVRTDVTRFVLPYFACDWKYAPDWYLWLLVMAQGQGVVWDSRPLHQYRVHGTSLSLHPSKEAVRSAEGRLAPLSALATASRYSQVAARVWAQRRRMLYALWLRRAAMLARKGQLRTDWVSIGFNAYHGQSPPRWLWLEVAKHSVGIAGVSMNRHYEAPHQHGLVVSCATKSKRDPLFG